jgi:hypothetical protein
MEEMFAKATEALGHKRSNAEITSPTQRYIIEIDWSFDDPLLKPALLELLNRRPEGTRPRKRHTGKRASSPMHRFKQLAAWRLGAKARLKYKEASQLIERRMSQRPKDDPLDLLPSYKSAGAWKDAVDAGQRLVRRSG